MTTRQPVCQCQRRTTPLLICCLAAWWIVAGARCRGVVLTWPLHRALFACLLSQSFGSNIKYLPGSDFWLSANERGPLQRTESQAAAVRNWNCWLNVAKALSFILFVAFLSCGHRSRNLKIVCVFIMADKAAQISQKNWNHKAIKSHAATASAAAAAATIKMPTTVGGKKHTTSWPTEENRNRRLEKNKKPGSKSKSFSLLNSCLRSAKRNYISRPGFARK